MSLPPLPRLPLCFEMHARDVIAHRRPPPMYCLAPRGSLLPVVFADRVREAFQEVAPAFSSGWWFEHGGVALRWGLPVGALFDLVGTGDGTELIPFRVTVRFHDLPRHVLPCRGDADVQTAFFNALKQAVHIENGSARAFMELAKSEQEDLWNGVVTARYFDDCKSLLERFRAGAAGQDGKRGSTPLVPVRLLLVNDHKRDQRFLQAPIPHNLTLGECLDVLSPGKTWESVSVHGLHPPLDAPILELCRELCAFDLFLYVVAKYVAPPQPHQQDA